MKFTDQFGAEYKVENFEEWLERGQALIMGRDPEAHVRIPPNDLDARKTVLIQRGAREVYKSVKKEHALLEPRMKLLYNLKAENETYVNGIKAETNLGLMLTEGSKVSLGKLELTFTKR